MEQADVVVVGAGLAGCSVAWHLAPQGRVVVLDQADQPGAEATSQNAGLVRRMGEDPYERALALRTHAFLQAPGEDWDTPSRRVGAVLGLVREPRHLHDAAAHLRARGVRVEALDRPGDVAPVLRGSPLRHAWYLPDERVADVHALLQGFLRGIRRHGGEVRCGERVTGLVPGGVRTAGGTIAAGAVVLAAGAWSRRLRDLPLLPLRRTLLQSAPHPLAAADHPWTWLDDVGLYVRPESGGWLCSPCDEALDPPGEGPGSRGAVEPLPRALAHDKIERFLPALADVRFVGGWSGLRTFAPDRRPVLGADPEVAGLWWAAGLGGFGVTCSFAVGEAVASWMRGEALDWIDAAGVSPGRTFPRRWPIRPDGDDSRLIRTP